MKKIIDGILHNPEGNPVPIFLYESSTYAFLAEGTTGTSTTYRIPENSTFSEVPEHTSDQIPIYDSDKDDWYLISDRCFLLDENGFFTVEAENPLLNTQEEPVPPNTEIEPPVDIKKPWFNEQAQAWEDKPMPQNLKKAVFNKEKGNWEESITFEEFIDLVRIQRKERLQRLDKPLWYNRLSADAKAKVDFYYLELLNITEVVTQQDIELPWANIFPEEPEVVKTLQD